MDSPITPMTPNGSCAFFEAYGLETPPYGLVSHPQSPTSPMTPLSPADSMSRDVCIRKCHSVALILKENWMDLIFTVSFPNLISQEKLVHTFSLQQLNGILTQGDLLPEEREEIRRIRCKARNNKAAKSLRHKYKEQDQTLADDVTTLKRHKGALELEREEILREISHFQAMGAHRN